MNITDTALGAGLTHVVTLAGPIPVELFHRRDALGCVADLAHPAGPCVLGPWRPATTAEEIAYEATGWRPQIGMRSRDRWALIAA